MTIDIFVQRQLENLRSGNGAYLEMFLDAAAQAGRKPRIVFAPLRSFGNRPWAYLHPRFEALASDVVWPKAVRVGRIYISLSATVWGRFAVRLAKALRARLGLPTQIYSYLGTPLDASEAQRVADICNAGSARLCVAEYSSLAPVLSRIDGHKLKGVLVHDLFSARAARFRANGLEPDFLEVSEQTELEWMRDVDVGFYASANEMAAFGPRLGSATGLWLRPRPPRHVIREDSDPVRVVFLGTRHAGNTDALEHFIDSIWPQVHAMRPGTEFWVAGSIGADLGGRRRAVPGVRVIGRVDDLAQIGGANSIGVAPTRLATGVSIKVAEYLMLGMPTVTYRLALEGFGSQLDDLVDSVADPSGFAHAVAALIDDPVRRQERSRSAARAAADRLRNDDVVAYLQTLADEQPTARVRAS